MKGQGLIEYVLILVMVAVVLIAVLTLVAQGLSPTTVSHVLVIDKQDIRAEWQGDIIER